MGTGRSLLRGPLTALLVAAGAVLLVVGLQSRPESAPPGSASTATGAVAGSGSGAPASAAATPEPVRAPARPGAPRRVQVPALGVSAPVVPVRAVDDVLVPPSDPQRLGWWADGARPGDRRGSALVTGHTVHTGGGALDELGELAPGSQVVVRTDRGRIVYEVARVRTYSKGRIARDAERLFSQDVPGRLVLITCADWDGARFLSNTVVVATPVAGRRT